MPSPRDKFSPRSGPYLQSEWGAGRSSPRDQQEQPKSIMFVRTFLLRFTIYLKQVCMHAAAGAAAGAAGAGAAGARGGTAPGHRVQGVFSWRPDVLQSQKIFS